MRTLILTANDPHMENSWESEIKKSADVKIGIIYKEQTNVLLRVLRKIHRYLPLPGYQIWLDDWWNELDSVDTIIAIAYDSTYKIFKIIQKKYPNIRRILYWWDPVKKTISPNRVSEKVCEKWSFCRRDAEEYGLKYNAQFLARDLDQYRYEINKEIKYDIMFFGVGGKKLYNQRVELLKAFDLICRHYNLKVCFGIKYFHKKDKEKPYAMEQYLNEKQYYEIVMQSRAMLDLTEPGQEWVTLRPIEALYLNKKLVTNNTAITGEKLYNPHNIFVIGRDSYDKLEQFIKSPFEAMPLEIYDYYSTKSWLKRFGENR